MLNHWNAVIIENRAKALGQHFTPQTVSELIAALALRRETRRVIDPTCGDGSLMLSAASYLESTDAAEVVGVELDGIHATAARKRLSVFTSHPNCRVIQGDLFLTAVGLNEFDRRIDLLPFDAVIGNPPYVRYQTGPRESQVKMATDSADGSNLVGGLDVRLVIRSCLIAAALGQRSPTVRGLLDATRGWLTQRDAPELIDPLARDWVRLVASYSGLADLALPMWLLTRSLCKPNGIVALVTTESIYNRLYGGHLRYFMLRYMQPLAVIGQEGSGWFANAQVRAVITVLRRRSDAEARVPLIEREYSSQTSVPYVTLHRHMNLASVGSLHSFGRALGFPQEDAKSMSETVAVSMLAGDPAPAGWSVRTRTEKDLATRLLSDLGPDNLARLESGIGRRRYLLAPRLDTGRAFLREVVKKDGSVPFTQLEGNGVSVHQGLRTGCNQFFYLASTHPDSSEDWMTWASTRSNSKGAVVRASDRVIRLAIPGHGQVEIPWQFVRPAIKSRAEARRWQINGHGPSTFLLLTGNAGRGIDLNALKTLPSRWLRNWLGQGLLRLPRHLEDYINTAEEWWLPGSNGKSRVFDLSAVAPNIRIPKPAAGKAETELPAPPRWWYSMELKDRHVAPIFVSRVNGDAVEAFTNRDDPGFVIDANFSTVTPSPTWPKPHLLAYLNSVFVSAWLEEHGTPMGGGALKVEAAHLRQLPLPVLGAETMRQLGAMGTDMAQRPGRHWEELKKRASIAVLSEILGGERAAENAYDALLAFVVMKRSGRSIRQAAIGSTI